MINQPYVLLDSGAEAKLEMVGGVRLVRPCPQAIWPRHRPLAEWVKADAIYHRSDTGGGNWEYRRPLPSSWIMEENGQPWLIKATGFGHLGIFPEQANNWRWLQKQSQRLPRGMHALNLFAYTGGSTLALAHTGAKVTHVDAARGVVAWARDNARNQGVADTAVQWLVEDVMRYCHREQKREHRYQGIILDPPTFGRGPKNELWKIESDLPELLKICRLLLDSDKPGFVLLSCHSPGFSPLVLHNLLHAILGGNGKIEAGEMTIPEENADRFLPAGCYARWLT